MLNKQTFKMAALALVAACGVACCGKGGSACTKTCDSCTCDSTCTCAEGCAKLSGAGLYDPANIKLDSMNLILHNDKTEPIQVNPNVTRKFIHLNNLMTVIVDFNNGPMAEADPFHSHPHEQITYVADGACKLWIGDQPEVLVKAGDVYAIPAGVPHTVQSTTAHLRLIDSFNPIREDFLQK